MFLDSLGGQTGINTNPDVVVIGGGPAGATVSTLIAQRGHRVVRFLGAAVPIDDRRRERHAGDR